MGAPVVHWLTIFLDDPVEASDRARRAWGGITGAVPSPVRGDAGQFATLVPAGGDAHLRLQAVGGEESGVHLDLHVDDVEAAAAHAVVVGAELVGRAADWVVLRSPADFVLCLVPHHGEHRAAPATTWPDGHRSRLDQLAVDVAGDRWERELEFWAALTGWEVTVASRAEFARLATPARLPVRVLLHRRRTGATRGHVDLATDDREAEVHRLEQLGLARQAHGPTWTVMQAPHGPLLCVTDRDPVTGLLR